MSDKVHHLKTVAPFFEAIWRGEKTAELRRDDRGFQVDDLVWLREWSQGAGYAGPYVLAKVTHVLGEFPGLVPGFAMLSFRVIEKGSGPAYRYKFEKSA